VTTRRRHRALHILGGMAAMAVFVAAAWWGLTRFAGGWGVPYFDFTTDNGSSCTNTWSGFVCDSITPADYALYTGRPLPPGTVIISGTYTVTHNFAVSAVLVSTKASAPAAYKALSQAYGQCGDGPTPDELADATEVCRMTTDDDAAATDRPPPDRTYTVTTGLLENGQRVTVVQIQSR